MEDRSTPTAAPGGDFNSIQYAPDGRVAQLAWFDDDLVYRVRTGPGADDWVRETVLTTQDFGHRIAPWQSLGEQLLFDDAGRPHVLRLDTTLGNDDFEIVYTLQDYQRGQDGIWSLAATVPTPGVAPVFALASPLAAAVGPAGSFHVAFVTTINGTLQLTYGTNAGGTWAFEPVAPSNFLRDVGGQVYAAQRYLSLAVDSHGAAHLAYTPTRISENLGTVFSPLHYATNRGGAWRIQLVYQPADGTGDAGIGSSIAVGPGDQIAIASVLVDRGPAGSPAASWLLFHSLLSNGTFATAVVARKPDGYIASDGPIGTGFAPMLRFDHLGRPLIAFSDFATVHNPYAEEYAGQIRLALALPGGWGFATLFRQADPYNNGVFFPTFALGNGEIAVTAGVNSGATLGSSLVTFVVPLADSLFVIGEPPDPPTSSAAAVAARLTRVRKGKAVVLFIEVTKNGSKQLVRCPFQPAKYRSIKVELIDRNGDGVAEAVRVSARRKVGDPKLVRRTLAV